MERRANSHSRNPTHERWRAVADFGSRIGISLLEVVLALAIFAGAMVAVGRIIDLGRQAAGRAQTVSEAVMRSETVMSEVVAGVTPMQSVSGSTFPDDSNWEWDLGVVDSGQTDLMQITVTVRRTKVDSASFSLVRLMRRPDLFDDATTGAAASSAAPTSASKSPSSPTSSQPGTQNK